ncbi:Crp/Fnr family transcriptional regulator [Pedobacter xixiisoli]|uniref:cAMP-binding domain of CRP or a regulatory subunit of cAMP-dependent protein kinases n=1 Tax=Pedobacter xixiisoli TaxID=1476464 RepID=A0A286AEB9_9SPHI|nr:Crp/Fnr family transcriptional regulator [Pedobacter xixiisoli]SOD20253.1 cAMP-binding domain of CRP or a regulatory subunit of cAMP-dependent protein kinases [Pedobacter xixiisoli]
MKNINDYEQLFQVFSKMGELPVSLKEAIVSNSKVVNFKKNERLLSEGEKSDSIYFIISGAVRVSYLNKEGIETNTWFLFENELVISVFSFFTLQPSFEYIETLEDSTFIVLKKDKLDWLYEHFVEFNIIGRRLTELYYIRNEAQANSLRMFSAKERYEQLIQHQPKLLNRISLSHISSYLGISRETLSRIRKK